MNVLMLYHRVPYPPNKGEKMRAWQQVRHMAERHRVWLACFVDAPEDAEHLAFLDESCERVAFVPLNRQVALARGALGLLRGRCVTDGYYGSRAMQQRLGEFSRDADFDVAFAFSSCMGAYIEDFPAGRRVLDMNDFDSRKWAEFARRSGWPLSELYQAEARRLAARERQLIERCDLTILVNPRECERCDDPALAGRITSLPTPMELQRYAAIQAVPENKVVGYCGTLDYRPNVEAVLWFVEHVWPRVRRRHPDAEFVVIGRRPPRRLLQLDRRDGVRVTGQVPDVLPHLHNMRVFAAAARTDIGVQTKVLEAMAAGRPTVITRGGHHGIAARAGHDYEVVSNAGDFARAVAELLDDHARCRSLGREALQFIRRHHGVEVVMPRFEELLTQPQPEALPA